MIMSWSGYLKKKKWHLKDFFIPLIPVPLSFAIVVALGQGFSFLFFLFAGVFLFVYLPLLIVFTDKVNKR